jgi:hypothetical protein
MIEDQPLLGSLMSNCQLDRSDGVYQLTSSSSTLKVLAFENISIISHCHSPEVKEDPLS